MLVSLPAVTAAGGETETPGGNSPLVIPAAAFTTDGDNPSAYWTSGPYLRGGVGVRVRATVNLPHLSRITGVSLVARDESTSRDVHVQLKRTPVGVMSETTTITDLQTSGSDWRLVYPTASHVDTDVDTACNSYWLEAVLDSTLLRLYSVHIHYTNNLVFGDCFESADTSRWDSTVGEMSKSVKPSEADTAETLPAAPAETVPLPEWMRVDSPAAQAALEAAAAGKSYASPVVIPGPAFKTVGSVDHAHYLISSYSGCVYARPTERTVLMAPVNLPDGAHITWFMVFYMDSNPSTNMRFWLSRMDTWDGLDESLAYELSSGSSLAIRSIAVPGSDLLDPDVNNSHHSYWVTVDLEGSDSTVDLYHHLYAMVILYTMSE